MLVGRLAAGKAAPRTPKEFGIAVSHEDVPRCSPSLFGNHFPGVSELVNQFVFRHSSRKRPLKDSTWPFCHRAAWFDVAQKIAVVFAPAPQCATDELPGHDLQANIDFDGRDTPACTGQ